MVQNIHPQGASKTVANRLTTRNKRKPAKLME